MQKVSNSTVLVSSLKILHTVGMLASLLCWMRHHQTWTIKCSVEQQWLYVVTCVDGRGYRSVFETSDLCSRAYPDIDSSYIRCGKLSRQQILLRPGILPWCLAMAVMSTKVVGRL